MVSLLMSTGAWLKKRRDVKGPTEKRRIKEVTYYRQGSIIINYRHSDSDFRVVIYL